MRDQSSGNALLGKRAGQSLFAPIRRSSHGGTRAFTLIELMLVMTILLIVLAVAFPSLRGFFSGRNLDSEARRLLALTRYGQSRAANEGVPMVLWIDSKRRTYGLEAAAGYLDEDDHAVDFVLDENLSLEATVPILATASSQWKEPAPVAGSLPMIRFLPDGFIGESSPETIVLTERDQHAIGIVQSANRLNYEIQANYTRAGRR
jgi:type II secretion system protein H